jgi:hypothetical protein
MPLNEQSPLLSSSTSDLRYGYINMTHSYLKRRQNQHRAVFRRISHQLPQLWGRMVLLMRRSRKNIIRSQGFAELEDKEDIHWSQMLAYCSSPFNRQPDYVHNMAVHAVESAGLSLI